MPTDKSAQTFLTFFVCPCGFEAKYHSGSNTSNRITMIRRLHSKVCDAGKITHPLHIDPNQEQTLRAKLSDKCADNQKQLHKEIDEFIKDAKMRAEKLVAPPKGDE